MYEGNSTNSNDLKATLCGDLDDKLPVLQSYTNMMTIIFDGGNSYGEDSNFKAAVSNRMWLIRLRNS